MLVHALAITWQIRRYWLPGTLSLCLILLSNLNS